MNFTIENYITCLQAFKWNDQILFQTGIIELNFPFTTFSKQELLIASHIKSWKDSKEYERTDINNGLLLNPTYDALFDKHLIGFEDSGKIILTSKVSDQDYEKLGVSISDRIHSLSAGNKSYLEYHRNQL